MRTVAVVDYGMGNLRSVTQAVRHAAAAGGARRGFEVVLTSRPEDVLAAERVVLPGQGAMPDCMRELRESGLQEAVLDAARRKPLMGVCVGMQMLLTRSEEGAAAAHLGAAAMTTAGTASGNPGSAGPDQGTPGLDLIAGAVVRFRLAGQTQPDGSRYKVPQMGWNQVLQVAHGRAPHPMWAGVPDAAHFYFVHSFYACPSDPRHSVGETEYGTRFTCVLARDNIFATQFHPEKSAEHGLALYRNFLDWSP